MPESHRPVDTFSYRGGVALDRCGQYRVSRLGAHSRPVAGRAAVVGWTLFFSPLFSPSVVAFLGVFFGAGALGALGLS